MDVQRSVERELEKLHVPRMLKATCAPYVTYVKEEKLFYVTTPTTTMLLCDKGFEAIIKLQYTMHDICSLIFYNFYKLVDEPEMKQSEPLFICSASFLTDSLYNIW